MLLFYTNAEIYLIAGRIIRFIRCRNDPAAIAAANIYATLADEIALVVEEEKNRPFPPGNLKAGR